MRTVIKTRAYKAKLKSHKDAILTLYSPDGPNGGLLLSASVDGNVRGWDLRERKIVYKQVLQRPSDESKDTFVDANFDEEQEDAVSKKDKGLNDLATVCFHGCHTIYGGYDDGLICVWNAQNGQLVHSLIGHTNRISHITATEGDIIFSCSHDCTVRSWNVKDGSCETVFNFASPVAYIQISLGMETMYVGSWDRMLRTVDIKASKIENALIAAEDSISTMQIYGSCVFVTGCDPVITGWNLETGECTKFKGHKGWVYDLKIHDNYLYSVGDDKVIRVWSLDTGNLMEEFYGHEEAISCIEIADGMLYTGSYDCSIRSWNIEEMKYRINERELMVADDVYSRKYEVFLSVLDSRKSKKGKKGKKKKK